MISGFLMAMVVIGALLLRSAFKAEQECEADPHWAGLDKAKVNLARVLVGELLAVGLLFWRLTR